MHIAGKSANPEAWREKLLQAVRGMSRADYGNSCQFPPGIFPGAGTRFLSGARKHPVPKPTGMLMYSPDTFNRADSV